MFWSPDRKSDVPMSFSNLIAHVFSRVTACCKEHAAARASSGSSVELPLTDAASTWTNMIVVIRDDVPSTNMVSTRRIAL